MCLSCPTRRGGMQRRKRSWPRPWQTRQLSRLHSAHLWPWRIAGTPVAGRIGSGRAKARKAMEPRKFFPAAFVRARSQRTRWSAMRGIRAGRASSPSARWSTFAGSATPQITRARTAATNRTEATMRRRFSIRSRRRSIVRLGVQGATRQSPEGVLRGWRYQRLSGWTLLLPEARRLLQLNRFRYGQRSLLLRQIHPLSG